MTINWSGGSSNDILRIQGNNATDDTFSKGTSFTCFAAASAGAFTVPPSVLLAVPPGNFGGMDVQPYAPYGTFSASGLNLGIVKTNYNLSILTTFQ